MFCTRLALSSKDTLLAEIGGSLRPAIALARNWRQPNCSWNRNRAGCRHPRAGRNLEKADRQQACATVQEAKHSRQKSTTPGKPLNSFKHSPKKSKAGIPVSDDPLTRRPGRLLRPAWPPWSLHPGAETAWYRAAFQGSKAASRRAASF